MALPKTIAAVVLALLLDLCGITILPGLEPADNPQILRRNAILVIVPHPDDEILGFGGIIYEALRLGKTVKVIVATNGDAYFHAAYFWKNGCPKGERGCAGADPADGDMEKFGLLHLSETSNALRLLGLPAENISAFGYPDSKLNQMSCFPGYIVRGNTNRTLSFTNKPFTGDNLTEDIKSALRSNPGAAIFTTHRLDTHDDHSALADIIQRARSELRAESLSFETYWGIIHYGKSFPAPAFIWMSPLRWAIHQREQRYKPDMELLPPAAITAAPLQFRMRKILWSTSGGNRPLLRKCIDTFKTQIGLVRSGGGTPLPGYEGWMDKNGYLLSFVRKNHLLWEAPPPEAENNAAGKRKPGLGPSAWPGE